MPYDSYNRFLKLAKELSAGLREISKFHFISAFSLPFLYTAAVTGTIEENKSVVTAVESIFKLRKFHFLYKRAMARTIFNGSKGKRSTYGILFQAEACTKEVYTSDLQCSKPPKEVDTSVSRCWSILSLNFTLSHFHAMI